MTKMTQLERNSIRPGTSLDLSCLANRRFQLQRFAETVAKAIAVTARAAGLSGRRLDWSPFWVREIAGLDDLMFVQPQIAAPQLEVYVRFRWIVAPQHR